MDRKPTYEELELRINELERKAFGRKLSEEALQASAGFLDTLVSSVSDGVIVYDDKFRYKLWNKFMEKLTGMQAENVLGKIAFDLFPHLREEGIDKLLERALAGETVQSGDTLYYVPDTGKVGWVTGLYSPHVDPSGNIVGVVAIVHDISDRKRAEEKLRESEEKYRLLVESTPDWVWMCDRKSRHTFSNNSVKEILGYEIHEILGTEAFSLIHKEDRKSVQKWFQNAKKQKKGWRGSVIRWQHKDKSIRFLETIAEPIFDDKGNLIGYSGIDRDVTARKLSEMALQKAHDELQEKTITLEVKKNSLEEINTAIKVLLKKRDEDKIEIESNVLTNVKELIEPYVEKIKKTKLDAQQGALLSIIESNINEIVSPFTRKMSLKYLNLTPTEIRIANLIRHGSTTKKIAEIMNVSPRTVETHRKNIRRKIGLDRKRANLRSHLLSLH
jgi:PAS domain S-box-containing protein